MCKLASVVEVRQVVTEEDANCLLRQNWILLCVSEVGAGHVFYYLGRIPIPPTSS